MITNDVQYRTAKAHIDRLQVLADDLEERPVAKNEEQLHRLEVAAVASQLTELRQQLTDYDALRDGRAPIGELSSLEDLPTLLIRARIASGLTQRALAERMGLKEQQIQRYESSAYASASLARLREIAMAVGLDRSSLVHESIDGAAVLDQLDRLGLDRAFVRRRLAPAALRDARARDQETLAPVIDLAARLGRVYGIEGSALLAGETIDLNGRALAANFKLPKGTSRHRVAAYTVYAHYLALVALQATEDIASPALPVDAADFRRRWHMHSAGRAFSDLLSFAWSLGIAVLPLADSGGFHAAVWRAHGRHVVVLKQGTRLSSRWAFDLLHEIGHIVDSLDDDEFGVIDADDMGTDPIEATANQFAGQVLLDGRAEELVQASVQAAGGSVERLKRVVPKVAAEAGVDSAALANYMAFRLSLQDINWWGAATNLQSSDHDPWETCRDALIANANLDVLNPLDRQLLNQALVP